MKYKGSGNITYDYTENWIRCGKCYGEGKITINHGDSWKTEEEIPCPECLGKCGHTERK